MSSLFANLTDTLTYRLHKLTYDPEAERYAQERAASEAAVSGAEVAAANKAAAEAKTDEEKKAAAERVKKANEARKAKESFRVGRFIGKAAGTFTTVIFIFAFVLIGLFGACLATNLNLYRTWPYRLLYAIYGFVFSPLVIVYVFAYRWFWLGKPPRFYALVPLIPYRLDHPWAVQLISWLSYKPDDVIDVLKEWKGTTS
jgi:hypothetical protein